MGFTALSAGERERQSERALALTKLPVLYGRREGQPFLLRGEKVAEGRGRMRGYFFAFPRDALMAFKTSRTNSSGCSSTIKLGIRKRRMPSVRK